MKETKQPSSKLERWLSSFKSPSCLRGRRLDSQHPYSNLQPPAPVPENQPLSSDLLGHCTHIYTCRQTLIHIKLKTILSESTSLTLPPHPHRAQMSSRFLTPCTMTPNSSRRLGSSIPSIFWMTIKPSRRALPSCHFRLVRDGVTLLDHNPNSTPQALSIPSHS